MTGRLWNKLLALGKIIFKDSRSRTSEEGKIINEYLRKKSKKK